MPCIEIYSAPTFYFRKALVRLNRANNRTIVQFIAQLVLVQRRPAALSYLGSLGAVSNFPGPVAPQNRRLAVRILWWGEYEMEWYLIEYLPTDALSLTL
jgi:hypothetical protein